jgi:outer membrane protein assembly complex protein YaeT
MHAWADTVLFEARGLQVRVEGVSAEVTSEVEAVVEGQVALTDDTTVTPPLADDLTFFLLLRYRELGYRDAVVRWDVVGGVALLRVNEGQRYSVGTITYEGNVSLPEADLTPYLLRPTHERVGPSVKTTPFVIADLKAGSELVQRYYHAEGYLDAVVTPPAFRPQPESQTVDVLVKVKEGQHYVFGSLLATGSLEGAEREVENQFKDLSGQPFNEVRVETLRKNIVGIYEQRGHYEPTVVAEVTRRSGGSVPVTYRVDPGPLYRIGQIDIAPAFSRGTRRILRSSFKRAAGHLYSPSELEFLTRHSLDSAMFSRLEVDLEPNADNTLTLDITGEEAPRTTLTASLGYDTFLGPFARAEARRVNVMDTGNSMRFRGEYSLLSKSAAIKWLDPAFLESAHSLDTELGAQSFTIFDYERRTLNLRTTLKKRWNKYISTDVYAEGSLNDTLSDVLTPEELGPTEYNLGIFGARIMLDFRDSPLLPTRGWVSSLGLAYTSGDTSYLRSEAMFAYYQRLSKKFRVAIGLRSNALHMTDGPENVPIDLRVFNGGATSVRSFPEREMGPRSRSGKTPLGGLMSQTGSVELSYEVRPNLELALFGDAGNLSEAVVNPFSAPEGLRYAIGLGIRYKLPIGPLRLDYGFNPDRKRGEPFGALHFTFGFAF